MGGLTDGRHRRRSSTIIDGAISLVSLHGVDRNHEMRCLEVVWELHRTGGLRLWWRSHWGRCAGRRYRRGCRRHGRRRWGSRCCLRRRGWGWTIAMAAVCEEPDGDTLGLVWEVLGVDVPPAVILSRAGVKGTRAGARVSVAGQHASSPLYKVLQWKPKQHERPRAKLSVESVCTLSPCS